MATATFKTIDPFTNIATVNQEIADQGATFLSNLRSLSIGDGGSNVFRADKNGIFLGGPTFATALFSVSMAGAVLASEVTIVGGTLRYGKTAWTDSAHDGYYLGVEGIYAGKATDATLFKFTIATGALEYGGKVIAATGSDIGAEYITGSITASQIGSVNATAITGPIAAGQITSITAGQITDLITASQIGSVNATAITGSITSSQISSVAATTITGSITSSQISSVNATAITGSITSGQITSITVGQLTGQISGTQIANLAVSAGKIANLTITADQIANLAITTGKIGNEQITNVKIKNDLSADKITAGTIRVGGTSQPTAIIIAASSITGNSRLGYQHGSRIWEDSSSNLGINAIGGQVILYCASQQVATFTNGTIYFRSSSSAMVTLIDGSQSIFYDGISCRGSFNVTSGYNARFANNVYFGTTATTELIWGGSDHLDLSAKNYIYFKINGSEELKISSAGLTTRGYFYSPNYNYMEFKDYTLTLTADKTAIIPTSHGFKALYCMESPEVWFMDFIEKDKKLDPLFKEVTISPYHYIKCEGGEYQVWGKRRGHEQKRFGDKTEKEFLANEKFLKMNQPLV